jgi:hypothetical protein
VIRSIAVTTALGLLATGCQPSIQHRVEPIEIHVRHDVTIRHVDERLEEFFAFQENGGAATKPAPQAEAPPQPAPTPPAPPAAPEAAQPPAPQPATPPTAQ